jgi:hypothetical protein
MEAYKGDTLASIFKSMSILADFPKQVIILKTTGVVCGLRGRTAGLQRRLIDEAQTRDFDEYCRNLRKAKLGFKALQNHLLELGKAADEQMERILADAKIMPDGIDDIAGSFTEAELKMIRTYAPIPDRLGEKLFDRMIELARSLFARHPNATVVTAKNELPNTFLFRAALCSFLWAVDWIAVGGAQNVKPERIRNDLVDLNFATFATYFDGLMSMDAKPLRLYRRASSILGKILAANGLPLAPAFRLSRRH